MVWLRFFLLLAPFFLGFAQPVLPVAKPTAKLDQSSLDQSQMSIDTKVRKYGQYPTDFLDAKKVQAELESLIELMRGPNDPKIKIVYINSPDVDTYITFGSSGCCTLVINRGILDRIQNRDQLIGLLGHEFSHSRKTNWDFNRRVGLQREELIDAELGALEIMLKIGANPRELRKLRLALRAPIDGSGKAALYTHPPDEFFITGIDSWLIKNQHQLPVDTSTPLSPEMSKLKQTAARIVVEPERAYVSHQRERVVLDSPQPINQKLSVMEIIRQSLQNPALNELRPFERLKWLESAKTYHPDMEYATYFLESLLTYTGPPLVDLIPQIRNRQQAAQMNHDLFVIEDFLRSVGLEINLTMNAAETKEYYGLVSELSAVAPTSKQVYTSEDTRGHALKMIADAKDLDFTERVHFQNLANPMRPPLNEWSLERLDKDWRLLGDVQVHFLIDKYLKSARTNKELLAAFRMFSNDNKALSVDNPLEHVFRDIAPKVIEAAVVEKDYTVLFSPKLWRGMSDPQLASNDPKNVENFKLQVASIVRGKLNDPQLSSAEKLGMAQSHLPLEEVRAFAQREFSNLEEYLNAIAFVDTHRAQYEKNRRSINQDRASLSERTLAIVDLKFTAAEHLLPFFASRSVVPQPAEIARMMANPRHWNEQGIRASVLARLGEKAGMPMNSWGSSADYSYEGMPESMKPKNYLAINYEEADEAFRAEAARQGIPIPHSNKALKGGLVGSVYEKATRELTNVQRALLPLIQKANEVKGNLRLQHSYFMALTERAPTDASDTWAKALYLNPQFDCEICLREALNSKRVWDLETRKKVFDRLDTYRRARNIPRLASKKNRLLSIWDNIQRINEVFTEQSLKRAQVLENFANEIKANQRETALIETAKAHGSSQQMHESLAIRSYAGIFDMLRKKDYERSSFTDIDRQIAFIRYLVGKDSEVHSGLKEFLTQELKGEDPLPMLEFLKNQFAVIPSELRAVVINPFLSEPTGMIAQPENKAKLIDLAVDGMGEYKAAAKLVLEAHLYSLQKTEPSQESLNLSFVLSQAGSSNGEAPGERFKNILQGIGGSGVSLGQKLYQRGLVPAEFLPHLEELQDQARKPSRSKIFKMVATALASPMVDDVLSVESILGDASSKVVLKVRYKDGRIGKMDEVALKIVEDTFSRQVKSEGIRLGHMQEYLEAHGTAGWKKLRSAVRTVQRGLTRQMDPRQESAHTAIMQSLYEKPAPLSDVRFRVIRNLPDLGLSALHVNDEVAGGISLKEFSRTASEADQRFIFGAIYDKEAAILLGEASAKGLIHFESDRHKGNFRVDMRKRPPEVHVYDYPLVNAITVQERQAVYRLLGLSVAALEKPTLRKAILHDLSAHIVEHIAENPSAALIAQVEVSLNKFFATQARSTETAHLVFSVLSEAEAAGVMPKSAIEDYLGALGNLEYYAKFKGQNVLKQRVERAVRAEMSTYRPHVSFLRKCFYFLRGGK